MANNNIIVSKAEGVPTPSLSQSASFRIEPPEAFNFSTPNQWTAWKRMFQRFYTVSGVNQQTMYIMGPQAEDVFQTFNLSDEQTRNFDYVLGKFENYFRPRRNVIYERAFNSRVQGDSESADDFATALYKLAETCEYAALKDDFMRDRLVVRLRDKRLSEKLQFHSALTWEKALTTARQNEAVKLQQAEIYPVTDSTEVGHVATKHVGRRSHPAQREQQQQSTPVNGKRTMIKQRTCGWCGRLRHPRSSCPAKNVTCNKCHKGGHFAAVCH
ncbi:uncharacterized protein LOC135381115 [Ornithodoros turicata]|uniref:uncharacterized protein LOC135381115 n=1 Tax=Ornithodoros turicata TaxID=34597 RepID=UPI00313A46A7